MQLEARFDKKLRLKDIAVTVPKTLHNADIFLKEPAKGPSFTLIDSSDDLEIIKTLNQQHPLINMWLACSCCSIGLLSFIFFVLY